MLCIYLFNSIVEKDLYQEEEYKELEYIPNETTVAQLFFLQEVVTYVYLQLYYYCCVQAKIFSWKLSDLSLVNLDDIKLLQLLEDAGAKSLGTYVQVFIRMYNCSYVQCAYTVCYNISMYLDVESGTINKIGKLTIGNTKTSCMYFHA